MMQVDSGEMRRLAVDPGPKKGVGIAQGPMSSLTPRGGPGHGGPRLPGVAGGPPGGAAAFGGMPSAAYGPYYPAPQAAYGAYSQYNTVPQQQLPPYAVSSPRSFAFPAVDQVFAQHGFRVPHNGMTGRIPTEYAVCRHFEQRGQCPVGQACRFAHGQAELDHWNRHYTLKATTAKTFAAAAAAAPKPIAEPFESLLPPRNPPGTATMIKQPRTFVLCRHFSIRGECKSGMVCKFAHGVHELDYWNTLAGRQRATPSEISKQMSINFNKAEQPRRMPHQGPNHLGGSAATEAGADDGPSDAPGNSTSPEPAAALAGVQMEDDLELST